MAPRVPEDPSPEPFDWTELSDLVVGELGAWLGGRCNDAAKTLPGVEAGDVFAAVMDRLMQSRTRVDVKAIGVRTYLARCVGWAVLDLVRKQARDGVRLEADELDRLLNSGAHPGLEPDPPDRALLTSAGLTPNQIDTVFKDMEFPELTWKEFAELVGRPYTAVRKDHERALRRLEEWLGLTGDERRVYLAYRQTGSITATASHTGVAENRCRELLQSARRTVRTRLHPREEG